MHMAIEFESGVVLRGRLDSGICVGPVIENFMHVVAVMSCLSIAREVPAGHLFLRKRVAAANLKSHHFPSYAPLFLKSNISSPFSQDGLRPA